MTIPFGPYGFWVSRICKECGEEYKTPWPWSFSFKCFDCYLASDGLEWLW